MKSVFFLNDKLGLQIGKWLAENFRDDIEAFVIKRSCTYCKNLSDYNLKIIEYESNAQIKRELKRNKAPFNYGFLIWWPTLIDDGLIKTAEFGFVNTHPSYLPYCRGKNYNFWAIVDEVPFGVTLHMVDRGIDTGDIVFQSRIPYGWEDTGETLYHKAQKEMYNLFIQKYEFIRESLITPEPQNFINSKTHYSSQLDQASLIDLNETYTARHLLNLLRARTFPGKPGCHFIDDDKKYEVTIRIRNISDE